MGMLHDIKLKIGTIFSGEGLKVLKEDVNNANQHVKTAVRGISQMSGALGEMDSSAAKAASAATAMIGAFASGNVVLIASQAAMTAISYAMKDAKEKADALKETAKELAKEMHEKFTTAVETSMNKAISEATKLREEFESITKAANELAAAANALTKSQANGTIADMEFAKLQAVFEQTTEQGRKLATATGDLAIAMKKAELSEAEMSAALADAREKASQADKRVEVSSRQLELVTKERIKMENALEAEGGKAKELLAAVSKLEAEEEKLKREHNELVTAASVATKKVEIAEQESANAAKSHAAEVVKAEITLKRVNEENEKDAEKTRELAEKKAKEAEKKEERAKLDEELEREEKKHKDVTEEARQARERLATAEKNLKDAEDEYAENLRNILTAQAVRDGSLNDPKMKQNRIELAGIEKMMKDFNTNFSVRDDQRSRREGELNQIAWENSNTVKQRAAEQYRWEQIKDKPDAALSQEQRDFRDAYAERVRQEEQLENRRMEAELEMLRAQEQLAALQDAEKQSYTDIASIKDKLSALGLK